MTKESTPTSTENRQRRQLDRPDAPAPSVATDEFPDWTWSPAVLDLIGPHCDITDRLKRVPPSARVRGVWFRIIDRDLAERGLFDTYTELFSRSRFRSLQMYPVSEFLVRAATAGALIASPECLHDGMFQMAHANAQEFARSLFGRTLIRLLARDHQRLTQQAIASSRQTTNYGKRSATFPDERTVEVLYRDEYVWIESYMAGAAVGTYESLGFEVELETELQSPIDGVIRLRLLAD